MLTSRVSAISSIASLTLALSISLILMASPVSANPSVSASEKSDSASKTPLHIVIDPGHGGTDNGAVYGHAREAEIVLRVSHSLRDLLKSDPLFKVSMTRETDHSLSLSDRVLAAQKLNADLFVSLHANAASDQRARGVEFYFQNHLPPDEETLFLAATENQMQKSNSPSSADDGLVEPTKKNDVLSIVEDLRRQSRMKKSLNLSNFLFKAWETDGSTSVSAASSIRQAPFYVVSQNKVPSVLIEVGFLSNPKEAERLMTADYQNKIARRIYQGLVLYRSSLISSNQLTISSTQ